MPSYIELNKSAAFPNASSANKVIFGINDVGQAVVVNSAGVQLPLSQSNFASASYAVTASYALNGGGGGGGNTPPIPCDDDFAQVHSYSNWIQGNNAFGTSGTVDKLTALAENNDPGDYLTLELVAGQVNGINISMCPSYSITLTSGDINYRDDGYGTYATNYVDFINGVFASHSLYTTFTGSYLYFSYPNNLVSNYCKVDNFVFIFKETGQLTPNNIASPMYYAVESIYGAYIRDVFSQNIPSIYPAQSWTYWPSV